jgi:putative spermidine/putrescine transport system substrate-binding protein
MEDAWINSVIFTAIYLKESSHAKIVDPSDLTEDELNVVMEFLTKHKRDGQFLKFWSGWEEGLGLIANGDVWIMTGWEPIVYAAQKKGLKVEYAVPKEGYEGWSNNLILHVGAKERNLVDTAHAFANWELAGYYGCDLAVKRGYVVPNDSSLAYAKQHSGEFDESAIRRTIENVRNKFLNMKGAVYWQNVRPKNYRLYEDLWSRLRAA